MVKDEGLERREVIPAGNKAKITLASCKKQEQVCKQHGASQECLWKGVGQQVQKKPLTDAMTLAQQVAIVEAAKAHLAAKGLPMAYYQLERDKKANCEPYQRQEEIVESEEEEKDQAREIKKVKQEHREKREVRKKSKLIRKKLIAIRLSASQPIAGPSWLKATTLTSVGKLTVVITKPPPTVSKLKKETPILQETTVETSRSEGEEGGKMKN
ncbi:hypothetical protein C0995_008875 [Termitomyces sp. Mi166|nr:hypothetical protein C0995_008875 [Termitomyces sp. Mi166\